MISPRKNLPKLAGHILVSVAALALVAGMALIKTGGVFALPNPARTTVEPARASGPQAPETPPQPASAPQSTNAWYSAQLHIHGWSNHNGLSQPGALQFHSVWADAVGLDAIWWSEHNPTYYQVADTVVDLTNAAVSTGTLNIAIPSAPSNPSGVNELRASVTGNGQAAASISGGLLRMQMNSGGDAGFDTFSYRAMGANGVRVQGLGFTRPLASDAWLRFDASLCGEASPDAFAEVRVGLSWHNYGAAAPQELIYRLAPAGTAAAIAHNSTQVTVTVPLSTTHVQLPLLAHAAQLPDSDDNSLQELYLKVGGRNGAVPCLQIGNFSLHSLQPLPEQVVQKHQQVAQRHQATYDVAEITSWEQFAGQRHLNPYLPSSAALLPGKNDIYVESFVPLIHSQNGLVALNHPFGAFYGPFLPPEQQEALVQSLLDAMIPVQGWDLDMIEIYKSRAQVDLTHHLRLWDLLAVNDIRLCAVAASDAHGGPFWEMHHMVTWIEAASPNQDDLLEGMRRCRAFFGDLSRFDGVLDLRLGAVPMGGVYPSHPGAAPLQIIADSLPAGAQVKLVQYRWIAARDLSPIVDHQVVDPAHPVMVDVSQPSILRVEAWSADNQPLALSNHIYILDLQCDVNGNGQTDIADVQSVAGAFGQTVPPAPASYDLQESGRIDLWDILAVAECWQNLHTQTRAPGEASR